MLPFTKKLRGRHSITGGTQVYDTPGTYSFEVPEHDTLTVTVDGGCGGGAGNSGREETEPFGLTTGNPGQAGTQSSFNATVIGFAGGGGQPSQTPFTAQGADGSDGIASGGDTNTPGGADGDGGVGGDNPALGDPGGGDGGKGGRAVKTYNAAQLVMGTLVTVVVGEGGDPGANSRNDLGSSAATAGDPGKVTITWS